MWSKTPTNYVSVHLIHIYPVYVLKQTLTGLQNKSDIYFTNVTSANSLQTSYSYLSVFITTQKKKNKQRKKAEEVVFIILRMISTKDTR